MKITDDAFIKKALQTTSNIFGVHEDHILGKRRDIQFIFARCALAVILVERYDMTNSKAATLLNRDHSGISHYRLKCHPQFMSSSKFRVSYANKFIALEEALSLVSTDYSTELITLVKEAEIINRRMEEIIDKYKNLFVITNIRNKTQLKLEL